MKKVAVGLSGGVDSAVSAALLRDQGYEVEGVFLECWKAPGCRVDEDRRDAADVARKLGIGFQILDFKKEYRERVVEYFYREYEAGRTPNPDVMCNKEIKFGMFYDWAINDWKYDFIATGHYARINEIGSKNPNMTYKLLRGVDGKKDQSYFLYQLREEQLKHVLFPLGEMTKEQVRQKAEVLDLPVAKKPDSQGICFIGPVSTSDFLKDLGMEEKMGSVFLKVKSQKSKVKTTGNKLEAAQEGLIEVGAHIGAWFYTVGQRHGFQIDGAKFKGKIIGLNPEELPPLYVIEKDVEKNKLVVGTRDMLMRDEFEVGEIHFVNEVDSVADLQDGSFQTRIRHGGQIIDSRFEINNSKMRVSLSEKVFGIAPGQACVFYQGEVVIGGGVIVS